MVLLSVVDHYRRVTASRVVGALLGSSNNNIINITNSFAIPFEETEKDFFFDSSYLQSMFELFYKVNRAEKIIGWYHSGAKMHKNDLEISKAFEKYCEDPILAIIDVEMKASDIPVQIFQLKFSKQLEYLSVQIGADETEEVGVEHLLRDIKEGTGCSLKDRIEEIKDSLKMCKYSLDQIVQYFERIENGEKPDYNIIELFQEIINDIPKIVHQTDMSKVYVLELINTLVAMNDLRRNRLEAQG